MYIIHFDDEAQRDIGPITFEECEEVLRSRGYSFKSSGRDLNTGAIDTTAYLWAKPTKGLGRELLAFIKEVVDKPMTFDQVID